MFFQANHDQLTGLLNRYAFDAQLREILLHTNDSAECTPFSVTGKSGGINSKTNVTAINLHREPAKPSVMCFIDMDRFKLVNDSCGHPAGDKLLKEISTIFRQFVNGQDLLARIGGDEFCIIFRNQSLDEVTQCLDKLLLAVSNYRFVYDDKLFFVGASIGVIAVSYTHLTLPTIYSV